MKKSELKNIIREAYAEYASNLKALHIAILTYISKSGGSAIDKDIYKTVSGKDGDISSALQILKKDKLVKAKIDANRVKYTITPLGKKKL